MYHVIVIQFVGLIYLKVISKFGFQNSLDIIIINACVIFITIVVSHFSFKYYESYFLNLKHKANIKRKTGIKTLPNNGS